MRFLLYFVITGLTIQLDRPVTNIVWCGASLIYTRDDETVPQSQSLNEDMVIFMTTEAGSVYQSEGTKWVQIEGVFNDVQVSPANSRVVYLFGDISYRTNDCGQTFTTIDTTELHDIKLNKMNWRWMLAFKKLQCPPADMDCRDPFNNQAFYSLDGGETWNPSFKNVRDASWDKILEDLQVPDMRIVYCFSKDEVSQVAYTDDYDTYTVLYRGGQGYFQTPQYLFILASDKDAYQLFFGTSRLHEFILNSVELPIQIYKEFSYTILDTDGGRIFISVSHFQEEQEMTNIYVSDNNGSNFKLALLNNVRSIDSGNCDFEKILGLRQVYIANIFDIQRNKEAPTKKSVITFDGGNSWNDLLAPQVDSKGEHMPCAGECSLQLQGRTQTYRNTLYTTEQAPGIAIGVGNIGFALSQTDLNTYLSKDGGQTWSEVRKGSHVYEMADFGGLIVMAKDDEPINEVIYSTDYGASWKVRTFYDDAIIVFNIATEVSGSQRYFIVYGKSDDGKGVAIKVDFSDLFTRDCKLEKDYEFWSHHCVNGSLTKQYRKKPNANCFNPTDLVGKSITEPCPCVREDWVCAQGYQQQLDGGECEPIDLINQAATISCVPGSKYFKSMGYVKRTRCQGGVDLGPVEQLCPIVYDESWLLLLGLGIVISICLMFLYRSCRRKQANEINCAQQQTGYAMAYEDEDDNML